MGDLHYLTASDAKELFARRELSPVELLDAVVTRTAEVEGTINALTEQMLEEAYESARESERRYGRSDDAARPLDGIPLLLKEEQPIAGRTIEEGSLLEKGKISDVTHPVVERIIASGAVVHGRTTTPEFSCAPFTHSALWGITRNPWNTELTPGGSSGGSGAALAAGATTLATGSDIGGSIRIPASLCGVVGFKPPFGRVPGMAPFNSDTYCADGPMARSVADVALLQNVLAGPHPHDQASLRPAYVLPSRFDDVRGLRVALCVNLGDYLVAPEVEANTRAAAAALADAGAIVDEVELPWTRDDLAAAAWTHFGSIFGASVDVIAGENADQLMAYTREFARKAAEAIGAPSAYAAGLAAEAQIYAPLGELLVDHDVMLCPTVASYGLVAGEDYVDRLVEVGDVQVHWTEVIMTLPFNVIGRVPVLAVPSGRTSTGLPTGVQLVGRTYDDLTVFRAGTALESALGLWADPTWRPGL
jgi:Asp-tRNA(Asn)/Glu-tRNA(Gln) amidotransferase A subunit family amidase